MPTTSAHRAKPTMAASRAALESLGFGGVIYSMGLRGQRASF